MRAEEIVAALSHYHFRYSNEEELQGNIAVVLERLSIPFVREYQLTPHDRLDFMCDGVVIETKTDGSAASVKRQCHRYAQHDSVKEIVLVTDKARHNLPSAFNGKPLVVHSLLWSAF